MNEITYHCLEVINTHLFNTKGPLPGKSSVGGGAAVAQPMNVRVELLKCLTAVCLHRFCVVIFEGRRSLGSLQLASSLARHGTRLFFSPPFSCSSGIDRSIDWTLMADGLTSTCHLEDRYTQL